MACHLMTLQLVLSVLLFSYIEFVQGQEEMWFNDGAVIGTSLTTRNGRKIQAFLAIPYAKPPVGPLRFKNPVPIEEWDDIRAADTDSKQCPQLGDDGVPVGDEDCLYLNVYTPKVLTSDTKYLYPTMVYIHGGDFVRGNGSVTNFGPGYLLDNNDVVLVTINYRLGVFGFLSTGDKEAPGNFGLKDQVLALKWVQKNIVYFRGDPERVTIFGQGAGGASVNLHAISDLSDGLFNQYISQSGTAMCFWAYNDNAEYKNYAVKLGEHLNCPTTNSRVLIDCLREQDTYNLVDSNNIFDDTFYLFRTWGPTDEPALNGAFLTMYAYAKIVTMELRDYRSIIGHVADEGLILTAPFYSNDDMYEKFVNNLDAFLRHILSIYLYDHNLATSYVSMVKELYFNATDPSDKEAFTKNITNFVSDVAFLSGALQMMHVTMQLSKPVMYLYSFEYRGTFSQTSRVIGSNENIGVTHTDDLVYLFPMSPEQLNQQQLKLSESDEEMINTIIDLWTSFADTGIPTTKHFSDPNLWQPYTADNMEYLKIGDNTNTSLSLQYNFEQVQLAFWDMLMRINEYTSYVDAITGR